jgi:hypothetical protein
MPDEYECNPMLNDSDYIVEKRPIVKNGLRLLFAIVLAVAIVALTMWLECYL